jgi:hypothetical protein
MKKTSKILLTFLIIFCLTSETQEQNYLSSLSQDQNTEIEKSATVTPNITIWKMKYEHRRGDYYMDSEIRFTTDSTYNDYMYNIVMQGTSNCANKIASNAYTSSLDFLYSMSELINSDCKFTGTSEYLLLNTTNANRINATILSQFLISAETNTYIDTTPEGVLAYSTFLIYYHLEPIFSLNSSYYSKDNIRCYIYAPTSYLTSNLFGDFGWTQYNIDQVTLSTPHYRIRLTDLEGNIIYEDQTDQVFSVYRTIDIDSFQITNNADEPIQTDFYTPDDFVAKEFNNNAFEKGLKNNRTSADYTLTYDSNQLIGDHLSVLSLYSNVDQMQIQFYNLFSQYSEMYQFSEISFWFYTERDVSYLFHNSYYNRVSFMNVNSNQYVVNLTSYDPGYGTGYSTDYTYLNYSQWYLFKICLGVMSVNIYNDEMTLIDTFTNTTYTQSSISYPKWEHVGTTQSCIYLDSICTNLNPTYYTEPNYLINETAQSLENSLQTKRYNEPYPMLNLLSGINCQTTGNYYDVYCNNIVRDQTTRGTALYIRHTDNSTNYNYSFWFRNQYFNNGTQFYLEIYSYELNYPLRLNVFTVLNLNSTHYHLRSSEDTTKSLYMKYDEWIYLEYSQTSLQSTFSNITHSITVNKLYESYSRGFCLSIYNYKNGNFSYTDPQISYTTSYYTHSNTQLNYSSSTFSSTANLTLQTNPYSQTISNISNVEEYLYTHSDLYDNELERGLIDFTTENSLTYTPAYTVQNFVSLSDQQNQYLEWENYKIYLNNSLIYSNIFYKEIGTTWNVSIYSRFDTYLGSELHTVDRNENWINIQINRYSLKIFNQQSAFMHYNLTLDPNYYPSATVFWSEWLSPNEIGENALYPDRYKLTLMHNETGTPQYASYELNFNTDDVLLVSSSNTLFAVLQNINNLNSSISEQFTYVGLNFTNTNSYIGNQTVVISLSFQNVNSTIEEILTSQNSNYEIIQSNLTTLFSYQSSNFSAITSEINNLYVLNQDSLSFLNSTANEILLYTVNSMEFNNNTLNTLNQITQNSFSAINSSFEDLDIYLSQNFEFVNDSIDNLGLEITSQFVILNSNITNNSIDISNSIYAINSSISQLTQELSNYVFLINNSIYSAVLDSYSALEIQNNMISGNLTLTYELNEELNALFQQTFFSEFLDWTNATISPDYIANQTMLVDFINQYNNNATQILLKYNDKIETLTIAALNSATTRIPTSDVEYKIISIDTGEELSEWTPITNKTIDFGYSNVTVPEVTVKAIPYMDIIIINLIFSTFLAVVIYIIYKVKNIKKVEKSKTPSYEPVKTKNETNQPIMNPSTLMSNRILPPARRR